MLNLNNKANFPKWLYYVHQLYVEFGLLLPLSFSSQPFWWEAAISYCSFNLHFSNENKNSHLLDILQNTCANPLPIFY